MRAGRLNRKVLIQHLVAGQDDIGQPVQTWVNLIPNGDGKVYASIAHLSGLETVKAGAETAVAKASIRIRYRADITSAMRVLHGATVYQIKVALPAEGARDLLDLVCEVVT